MSTLIENPVISQTRYPALFVNPQIVRTKTGDGKDLIVLSGVVKIERSGKSVRSGDWAKGTFRIGVNLGLPPEEAMQLEQHASLITLSSVRNDYESIHAGWAVDESYVLTVPGDTYEEVFVQGAFAVRDKDGWLLRVGYHVTLVGQVVSNPRWPPDF